MANPAEPAFDMEVRILSHPQRRAFAVIVTVELHQLRSCELTRAVYLKRLSTARLTQ